MVMELRWGVTCGGRAAFKHIPSQVVEAGGTAKVVADCYRRGTKRLFFLFSLIVQVI
jgi:hypothetical protein